MDLSRVIGVLLVGAAFDLAACTTGGDLASTASSDDTSTETDAERRLDERLNALRQSPVELEAFLRTMPKGGDLHNHLSGAIYAESYLAWAKQDGLCANKVTFALVPAAQCSNPANIALPDSASDPLYKRIVDAWSMADFDASGSESGHDHFFNVFGRFGLVSGGHTGEMIAEAANRAAAENELYLELMLGIGTYQAGQVANAVWGTGRPELTPADFASFYDQLLASADWPAVLTAASQQLDGAEAKERTTLACDGAAPAAGCGVTVRYLYQASRLGAAHQLFAQFVAAFEVAMRDKRVVGMNLVSPEDNPVALRDYELQMQMLDFLHGKYAGRSPLHVALHAGELTASVLPAAQQHHLTFHIRRAVEVGHAERIGHGVDLLSEDDSAGLRAELAQKDVLVEVCLTSNAYILNVSGTAHPLSSYLADHVPVSIATDDPGVSRSNMTKEYVRAAVDQGLGYSVLKRMTRDSLEHAFLPGESLWRSVAESVPAEACSSSLGVVGRAEPADACRAFLAKSERATMQWELERRLAAFELAP